MASVSESSPRANIRIEIKNDFTEEMDVDYSGDNIVLSDIEVEDGEISDGKSIEDVQVQNNQTRKLFTNRNAASSKTENKWKNSEEGVDIFCKEEQEKLQTRAQRFGLNPIERKKLTVDQLQELHDSLGISKEEINTRFEAIHMYGTKEMSTQDVFDYFGKYGPSSIEWLNDVSCNVVWMDKSLAARAFFALSKEVDGMPMIKKLDEEKEKENVGRSILLKDQKIHISEINVSIPPGYWRLGYPHLKSKYILLRFANKTDKKPLKSEKFSEYSRKYGNPNFGGIRGLISESKKKKMKGIIPEEKVHKGNPWGNLAKNWNNDPLERLPETEETHQPKKVSKSILNRLGTNKRTHQSEPEEEEEEKPDLKKSKVPRMRMYADEEEARIEKVKQMKKIRELEKIEEKMAKTVPDLRNRIGRHVVPPQPTKKVPVEPVKLRPVRIEVTRKRSEEKEISSENSDEDMQVQQKSKVTVIVKKPPIVKPTVASTIWSRLDLEKRKQKKPEDDSESKSDSSKSDSSDSESDSDNSAVRNKISKAVNSRPGFSRDLKSRLGLNTDHKSPLRIEINNDHYKKT